MAAPTAVPPLHGLVLAGGRSVRMGRDKASLAYHGRPQAAHILDLLSAFCIRSYVSCRADQAALEGLAGLPQLHDAHADMGPLAGILTAFEAHPEAAWLVVACDLPYLDRASLAALVAARDPSLAATAFASSRKARDKGSKGAHADPGAEGPEGAADGLPAPESLGPGGELPEPLCAIYEPRFRDRLRVLMPLGVDCPRKALIRSPSRILLPLRPEALANVNLPEEYRKALTDLSGSEG